MEEEKENSVQNIVKAATVWKFITAIVFLFSTAIVWLSKQNEHNKDVTIEILKADKQTLQIQLDSSLARREHEGNTYLDYFITEVRMNREIITEGIDTLTKGQMKIYRKK